jgi:hypothetical protein
MLVVGDRPTDIPFTEFLLFQDELEEYWKSQIEMQSAAIEKALSNFWEAINS